jgi:hypothetical protein
MARCAALLLAGLFGLAPAALAQRTEAGLVDSVAGFRDSLRVFRDGRWEPLARLHPLYAGDSVAASGPGTLARLRLYGRNAAWVCADRSARAGCGAGLKVGAPARGGGLGVAIRGLINTALAPLRPGAQWTRKVSTVARGDGDVVAPLLGSAAELGAGNRVLSVAWVGGKPPFAVRVVKDGSGEIAGVSGVAGQSALLGRLALTPGDYGLRIEDAGATVRLVRFRVVPAGQLPRVPQEYLAPELSGGTRTLIGALWLAGQGDGRWAWEAYLRLGTLRDDVVAERLRAELAAGRLPPG